MEEEYLGFLTLDLMELERKLHESYKKYVEDKDEVNSENYGRMCDECSSLLKSLQSITN